MEMGRRKLGRDRGIFEVGGQDWEGGGIFSNIMAKVTGKTAKKLATKAAEKGIEKIGEKTGELIGDKIQEKFATKPKVQEVPKAQEVPKVQEVPKWKGEEISQILQKQNQFQNLREEFKKKYL